MMRNTVAQAIGALPVALALNHAAGLLATELPTAAAGDLQASSAPERFAVARGVAVVPVRGLLTPNNLAYESWFGWSTYRGLTETARELAANEDVRAVILDMNSPGGLVLGLDAAARAVRALAQVKPVHVLADPMAASAAYYLASQGNDIAVAPGAIVGSIGTARMAGYYAAPDYSGTMWHDFTSSHARAKIPDPSTEEGKAEIQRSLDEAEAQFHAAVATGRGIAPEELTARLSVTDDARDGGAVFYAEEAIARGLADTAEAREDFFARIFGDYAPPQQRRAGRAYLAQAAAAQARAAL